VQRQPGVNPQDLPANPSDGFRSGEVAEPPKASILQKMDMTVTPEQLTSAAFQQTLVLLSASGIHVNLTVVAATQAQPAPRNEEAEFRQDVRQSLNRVESNVGYIAEAVKPQAKPPTYGGD
jgi:hypothetical protein